MMLHIVYQLRLEFTMPPRDNRDTQPSQSVGAWYAKIKPIIIGCVTMNPPHKCCNSK